jgi:hypothetical protein
MAAFAAYREAQISTSHALNRTLHLLDSFEGLPTASTDIDSDSWNTV